MGYYLDDYVLEAIILAGGEAWRLKPHTYTPKPLVEIRDGLTLLEYQVSWLRVHGYDRVLVASRKKLLEDLDVEWVLEGEEKLGTGGALKNALKECYGDYVYVMNVDDIVFYNPLELLGDIIRTPSMVGVVLGAVAKYPFGVMELEGNLIVNFVQKPSLPYYTNAGHYLFDRERIRPLLPDKGDFENEILPRLARERKLMMHRLRGSWITINTMKDLLQAREILERGV